VPLGIANNCFLSLDGDLPDLSPDGHVLGAVDRVATGTYIVRPHAGRWSRAISAVALARELEAAGPAAMAAFAVDELAGLFGEAIRPRLGFIASSAWASDAFARGSYSFALPGHSGTARGSQRRSTTASILRARRARRTISRPRTAPSSPVSRDGRLLSPTTSEGKLDDRESQMTQH